ncbi:lipoprotein NlpD [Undibacterium sp. GrIS 1.8]
MSMKKLKLLITLVPAVALSGFITACSTTPNNAPVIDRGSDSIKADSKGVTDVSKVVPKPADTRGTYVVKRGDTLFRIALDNGQSYSDLVAWNNLKNPNDIKVDQVLRVAPPDGTTSVQTGSVNTSGVEVRSLTAAPINPSTNKTSPRGDKRPYSDANLAELQKLDSTGAVSPATPGVAKSDVVPPAAVVAVPKRDKPIEATAPESDVVDWIWPAEGKVIAGFDDAKNKGLDISGKLGQSVMAAGAGKVMYAGNGIRGYGNLVIIKHTSTLLSAYAHNKTILVTEGQTIAKGQRIAEMGDSDSDTVKLHFEIRQQGKPVDPSKFLPHQ